MNYTLQQQTLYIEKIKQFTTSHFPLMMITGALHNEKKALVEEILRCLRISNPTIRIHAKPSTTPKSIKTAICRNWSKIKVCEQDAIQTQLQTILNNLKSKRPHVLIVTQSEQLPLPTLEAIVRLARSQEKDSIRLHILLCGHLSLTGRIQAFITDDTPQIILKPMPFQEKKKVIKTRLNKTHITTSNSTVDNMTQCILDKTDGLPKARKTMLNRLSAERPLPNPNTTTPAETTALTNPMHRLWQKHGVRVLALAGLLCAAIYMNWHYHHKARLPSLLSDNNLLTLDKSPLPPTALATPLTKKGVHATPNPLLAPKHAAPPPLAKTHLKIKPYPAFTQHKPRLLRAKKASTPSPVIATKLVPPTQTKAVTRPRFYILQLMSTQNKTALQRYATKHQLLNSTQVYASPYQGHPWHLLGYGHYPTPAAAHQALNHLTPKLKALKPWVRPMHYP